MFPEARARSEDAIEATVLGRTTSQQALANAANLVNQSIATYNRTMGLK